MHVPDAVRVVSCEGAGVRALAAALMFQSLDRRFGLAARTDLFVGSSAGAVAAIALAAGVPAARLVELFETHARRVFTPYRPAAAAEPPPHLGHVRFVSDGLRALLLGLLGAGTRLADLPKPVAVTAVRLSDPGAEAWYPVSLDNLPGSATAAVPAVEAALAAAATPTLFPPCLVQGLGDCVDGGMLAAGGWMSAAARMGGGEAPLARVRLLSLGSGIAPHHLPPEVVERVGRHRFGVLAWMAAAPAEGVPALALPTLLFEGAAHAEAGRARQLLGDRFHRADVLLSRPVSPDGVDAVPWLGVETRRRLLGPDWGVVEDWVGRCFTP